MAEDNYWMRLQRRSLSRRTMLRGAAVGGAGLAGAALIGCGGDDDDDGGAIAVTTPTAEVLEAGGLGEGRIGVQTGAVDEFDWIFEDAPKNVPILGNTRVSTYSGSDDHFSPWHLGGLGNANHAMFDNLFSMFFRGDNPLQLRAAEKVERPDGSTAIITLRDARFSPNNEGIDRPVDAEDIFAVMELLRDDFTVYSPGIFASTVDWDQTSVVDQKTLSIAMTRPRNDFFVAANVVFPAKELTQMHASGEKSIQSWDNPVGSGPYYQTSFTPGTKLELTKNPNYSRAPWPFIENRELLKITDTAALQAQFRAGNTYAFSARDKLQFDELLEDLARGEQPRAYGIRFVEQGAGLILALHGDVAPWTDVRAREAVTRAIDIDRAIDILEGGEAIKSGPGISKFYDSWNLPEDDPLVVDYLRHDPERSRQLLDALRADGVDVDRDMIYVAFAGNQKDGDRAVLLSQMLEEAGWNIRVDTVPSAELTARVLAEATCTFDLTAPGYPGDYALQLRAHHTKANWIAECVCMCDPTLDTMIEKFEITIDDEGLREQALDIERYLIKNWSSIVVLMLGFGRTLYKSSYRNVNPAVGTGGYSAWIDDSYFPG